MKCPISSCDNPEDLIWLALFEAQARDTISQMVEGNTTEWDA